VNATAGDSLDSIATAEARAIDVALAPLEGYARPAALRMHAVSGWKADNNAAVWVVGEFGSGREWNQGAEADLILMTAAGSTVATARSRVESGQRIFQVRLTPEQALVPGEYVLRARVRGADAAAPVNEVVRIALSDSRRASGALFTRRGLSTGNKE